MGICKVVADFSLAYFVFRTSFEEEKKSIGALSRPVHSVASAALLRARDK